MHDRAYKKRFPVARPSARSDAEVEEERVDEDDVNHGHEERPPSKRDRLIQASLAPLNFFAKLVTLRAVRLGLFVAIGAVLSLVRRGAPKSTPPQEVLYSDFLQLCTSGNVKAVRFEQGSSRLVFDVKESMAKESAPVSSPVGGSSSSAKLARQFYTRQVPDPTLTSTLRDNGVTFGTIKPTFGAAIGKIVFTALALWVPLVPMFIIMRRFIDGRNGTNRSKRTKNKRRSPRIRFDDVAGVDVAKQELEEVVACLKDGRRFARVGAQLPSGVLLCGPPGTGKTLLAKAVAGEADVPFLSVAASEFVEMFVGRGAARIRELFAEARKRAPCVVFIDELVAIGGRRGAGLNEERDQTLNQLLTELDGFEGRPGIVLLAATNRAEVLDPALTRPGRLSRKVNVPLPSEQGRAAILRVHLRKVPIVDLHGAASSVARISAGMSGADLANCVNEAAFLAARRDGDAVTMDDLNEAVLRTRFGVNGAVQLPQWLEWMRTNLAGGRREREIRRSAPLGGG